MENILYAIVIGEAKKHQRYITHCPFHSTNKPIGENPLAIYLKYARAQTARRIILKECGHKSVYIVRYALKTKDK